MIVVICVLSGKQIRPNRKVVSTLVTGTYFCSKVVKEVVITSHHLK